MKGALLSRGEWRGWQLPANDANGVDEGKPIGIILGGKGGLVHQATNGEMGHHQAVELLADHVGGLAAQNDPGAAQMGLQFIEAGLDFPPS